MVFKTSAMTVKEVSQAVVTMLISMMGTSLLAVAFIVQKLGWIVATGLYLFTLIT